MRRIRDILKAKNIACGYLYSYIHLITEIACFYMLYKITNNMMVAWLAPFIYDGLAFVPQALIGYINDKYPKIKFSVVGTILMVLAYIIYFCTSINLYFPLILLCLGNACIHINGAEVTLKCSNGMLSHSAIFVAGGSFGVIIGRLLSTSFIPFWGIVILMISMIPFILLAETYNTEECSCKEFDYVKKSISPMIVILLTVFVVIVRGYLGYGIPTSWNKTVIQAIILYFTMGIGKALGGILSDIFGIRKVAVFSTVMAIPFLCIGDNLMIVSLIGVMFFSMTMSITLAILTSILKNKPGLAFGLTTIGLFLGTAPIFFVTIINKLINIGMITVMSLVCTAILLYVLKKDKKEDIKNENNI